MSAYQPKTGAACECRRGQMRDNCAACGGTGRRIDFAAIRARAARFQVLAGIAVTALFLLTTAAMLIFGAVIM